jgi:hypothetical protein
MDKRVTESELPSISVKEFGSVLLVRPGDAVGVSVEALTGGPCEGRPKSVLAGPTGILFIEVEDPRDASTMARVEATLGLVR